MYANTSAVIRPDLMTVVEQALGADAKFIGQQVLPVKFSKRKTGEFHKIDLTTGGLLDVELGDATLRAPKTAYKEVSRSYTKAGFECKDRGLEEVVDDADAAELAPSFDAESFVTRLVTRNILLSQEARVKDLFFSTGNFGSAANSYVAYTEGNIATMDIAYDVRTAITKVQKRGEQVNAIIIPIQVWERARRSTLLRKYLFGENGGNVMVTRDAFAKGMSENGGITVFVPEASYNTAKKGQSVTDATLGYIWPATYIWVGHIAPADDMAAPAEGAPIITEGAGRTIIWEEQADALAVVETYRDEKRRSDIVRVRQYTDERVMNGNAGALIATQYS